MSHGGQAAYVRTCRRPDITCVVNQLSKTKHSLATESEFKRIDEIFSQLKGVNLNYDLVMPV